MRRTFIIFGISLLVQMAGWMTVLVAIVSNGLAETHAQHIGPLVAVLVGIALIFAGLGGLVWFVVRIFKYVEVQKQRVRRAVQGSV
jgi:hypothetical protein